MDQLGRLMETVEVIAAELERLRILKEHELGVRVEYDEDGPYVLAKPVEE